MRTPLNKNHYIYYRSILKAAIVSLTIVINCFSFAQDSAKTPFNILEERIFRTPYTSLPQLKVSPRNFGKKGVNSNNYLFNAAKRTLTDNRDWLAESIKPKLFNANGICFTGKWIITTPSRYSGLFSQNTRANVIARASVALPGTKQKHKRAYGVAIKIFDTKNSESANLFVMHSMAGAKTKYVLDLELDNQPKLGGLPPITKIPTLLRINKDLERADEVTGAKTAEVNYRSAIDLAQINNNFSPVAPTWVKLVPTNAFRVDKNDFRDEMSTMNYPEKKLNTFFMLPLVIKAKKRKRLGWSWVPWCSKNLLYLKLATLIYILLTRRTIELAYCERSLHK